MFFKTEKYTRFQTINNENISYLNELIIIKTSYFFNNENISYLNELIIKCFSKLKNIPDFNYSIIKTSY